MLTGRFSKARRRPDRSFEDIKAFTEVIEKLENNQ
jgi:hypothetical protein